MFRIMFDLPRSSICIKDLLLHINPSIDIKECTYETISQNEIVGRGWVGVARGLERDCYKYKGLLEQKQFVHKNRIKY